MPGAAYKICGAANMMHGVASSGVVGRPESVSPPPLMAKNRFLLNGYLGIFMHFESIFFYSFKSGKWTSDPPTH